MKSIYKREISADYFRPLSSFRYNPCYHPHVASKKQLVLARNLSRSYQFPEGNILRLIMYTEIALNNAVDRDIELSYSDLSEIIEFEREPEPIDKLVFKSKNKSFEIVNPFIIDHLYYSIIDLFNFQQTIKKRRSVEKISTDEPKKKVAAELFDELTQTEKISHGKSYCIIGFIFCLYNIHLESESPLLSENHYNKLIKEDPGIKETYLQYLAGRIKSYFK